ncbi:serine/arginine-rich splicing factor SR45a-like isoform X1 [Rhododendron vialii]|uniref:serine/arginine-rich splicing factor SR45a-like isoform X1 n=1 Tax=Rhododendron vialii TaxID=182163 RepID=UPI00265E0D3D|nr:serine/arginine-rich splicing factor SR45a-like isoform X1 [Rhododendron vialii]XP_058199424.1 serine/arginine-rich splicing factor SR45a-like isoform X1 [Rhododendron vialii]XP_058199432.1 serine/arginine-rich splicing factor SR45a-like isoform X1 [Rhododendron vialii]
MSHSREGRSSASPPYSKSRVRDRRSRSLSGSRRSRSRSRDSVGAVNPGNNLYVTGLSTRVTNSELEKYFSREGKVTECQLVTDPHTKESRGFAFVTMETNEDAERCIKHLNRSVLEGRLITVEMDVTTHLHAGMREILVPVKAEEDHAPRTVGGAMMITLTRMGGVVVAATEERINSTRLSTTSHFKFSMVLVMSCRVMVAATVDPHK